MNEYIINFTDPTSHSPIEIQESETAKLSALTLFGRIKPEYGEELDQDFLNLLENYACPELPGNDDMRLATPDHSHTTLDQLRDPVVGQFWFNSTRKMPYFWDGTKWDTIGLRENLAANWGQIMHGSQMPKPISPKTGLPIEYENCIWSVAPSVFVGRPAFIACASDNEARVTMKYRLSGTETMLSGMANYLIIGIRGNYNAGENKPPIEITPTPTPSVTASPTPSVTPTITPSNTASVTPTPTLSLTPSATPVPSISATPAPSSTPLPTVTPTITPSASPAQRPYYQVVSTRCTFRPNSEVIYGCPEVASNYNCQTLADIGNTQTTTSDCRAGNGVNRCVDRWECKL